MDLLANESVFQLFDGLDKMPEEAFIHSKDEILGMIGPILSDPGYRSALAAEFNEDPEKFKNNVTSLVQRVKIAESYPENKRNIMTQLLNQMISDCNDTITCGGYFQEVEVKVLRLDSDVVLPTYGHPGDAGMDVRANEDATLQPFGRKVIKTGLQVIIPGGYEIQVRPRSGLALKQGLTVANTPGTIDAPYRKEIGVIAINLSNEAVEIHKGDRIAQLVLNKVPHIVWNEVDESTYERFSTERGEGFGSSGV